MPLIPLPQQPTRIHINLPIPDTTSALEPSLSYAVYSKAAEDFSRTLIASVVGTGFLWWLSGVWRLGAILGFVVIAVIVALDLAQVLFVCVVAAAVAIRGESSLQGEKWMVAATAVRVVGAACGLGLLWFLFGKIWP